MLELHWQLTPSEWLQQLCNLDPAPFWAAAQPLELEGARALQLAPYDLLLHLCVHLTVHGYGHGVGFANIVRTVAAYQPFAWDHFLARTTRFRLRALCYYPLETCVAALGTSIPAHVLAALRPPPGGSGWCGGSPIRKHGGRRCASRPGAQLLASGGSGGAPGRSRGTAHLVALSWPALACTTLSLPRLAAPLVRLPLASAGRWLACRTRGSGQS